MKRKITKQTYLKGLLLFALAANMSWHPAMDALNAVDVASETVRGEPTVPGPVTQRSAPLPKGPNGVTVSPRGIQPPPSARVQVEVEGEKCTVDNVPKDVLKVCGLSIEIKYEEEKLTKDGKTGDYTIANATEALEIAGEKVMRGFRVSSIGTVDKNVCKGERRKDIQEAVANEARKRLKELGKGTCAPSSESIVSAPERRVREVSERRTISDRRERTRRERDERDCRRDSTGRIIKDELEVAECKLQNLADLDTGEDDRETARRKTKRAADEVLADLKPIIKDHLSSEDSSKRADGKALLAETRDTIKALRLDKSDERRADGQLKAVELGSETIRKTREAHEKADELGERIRDGMKEVAENPHDPMAANYLNNMAMQLKQMRERFEMDIRGNSINQLIGMRRDGFLTGAELQDYTSEYDVLQSRMARMMDPTGSGLGGIFGRSSLNLGPLASPNRPFAPQGPIGATGVRAYGVALPGQPPALFGGGAVNSYTPGLPTRSFGMNTSSFGPVQSTFGPPQTGFRPSPLSGPAFTGQPPVFGVSPSIGTPSFGAPTIGGRVGF